MTNVEITASTGTLEEEKFPIMIEVPNEVAEDKEALDRFICNYLDENEVDVKEWVLSEKQEQEAEMEMSLPF